jgi:hypothetical protein
MDPNDPNANLFGKDEEQNEEEIAYNQTYGKNPSRSDAIGILIYEKISEIVDSQENIDEESKRQMIFKMAVNSVLDLVMDSASNDEGMDLSYSVDMFLGVALANMKYEVDLFREHEKALVNIKPSDFKSEDEYRLALDDFENNWWDVPQPILDKRTPNDAIRQALDEYGLAD